MVRTSATRGARADAGVRPTYYFVDLVQIAFCLQLLLRL